MAWLQKRSRRRRVSADRSKPVPTRPSPPLIPPGKRAARCLMTIVFLIGGVTILTFPVAGPRLQVGDIAHKDYRARTAFRVIDSDATRRARDLAEARCPRAFRENADHLERIPGELQRFLFGVIETRTLRDFASAARTKWGADQEKLASLRQGLDRKWVQASREAVEAAVKNAGTLGIMEGSVRKGELDSERYEIVVFADADSQKRHRRVELTLDYPDGLREFFAEELAPVLNDRSPGFRQVFLDVVTHGVTPTFRLDTEATAESIRAAVEAVPPVFRTIAKNRIIVAAGEQVTLEAIDEFREESAEFARQRSLNLGAGTDEEPLLSRRFRAAVGVALLFIAGFVLLAVQAVRLAPEALASNTRVGGVYTVCLVALASARVFPEAGISPLWSPVILGAMILAVATGPVIAFGASALVSVLAGFVTGGGLLLTAPLLAGSCVSAFGLRRLTRRSHVFEAGMIAGIVQFVVLAGAHLAEQSSGASVGPWPVQESLAVLGGGILAGSVLTGALPYVEKFFDVATDLRLLEWTDQNQPLLRKLALEAPGTYHHSTVVSNMTEAAAKEIGANAPLARVGGYLHDVGKLSRPEYFIENTSGLPSRHEKISPMLSALILTAHTKDGVELAAQYGVPTPIRRIIAEHHGTSVVEFFYSKALKEAEASGGRIREGTFRYRGPKPRSREAAIVMLADSAESAARSLDGASPTRLERLVRDIVEKRLKDGQLDESGIHITDLARVEKSLVRSLTAMMHPRVRYPSS